MEHAQRLALGQWFTPPAVARIALALALRPGARRIIDPSCGDGAFLAAAAGRSHELGLYGVEVDNLAAARCRARVPEATVRCVDLFDAALEPDSFDAVVGNPPYVRQERLTPAQKAAARRCLARDWPHVSPRLLDRIVGRGDLAAAVIAHSMRLLRPGGRLSFVVSSALLDAGYAAAMWELVAQVGAVRAVIDAPSERWFSDAAINPVIVVIERGAAPGPVDIARLGCPTTEAAERVSGLEDLAAVAEVRAVDSATPERWSVALRADAAWYEFAGAAAQWLVPLGSIANVRRGLTSGANQVFYLDRGRATELGLEAEALQPLVRAPNKRGLVSISIDPTALADRVLCAPPNLEALPVTRAYLDRHAAEAERSMLRAREPWWSLPVHPARLFLTKAYAARFVQRLAPSAMIADQRVYSVEPAPGVDLEVLGGVLNSSYTAFALESLGRASMGEGALEWTGGDAARLPVIDPRRLDASAVRSVLAVMASRPIGTVEHERDQPDRRALDLAVGRGLPPALLPRIHTALITSVARRGARARSG